ncbi:MAG: hypothetical protein ABIO70_31425 [Pseudomonadota bacterium]
MEPAAALLQTLSVLFDENELRTLFSTDLYLGDLSHRMPPRGAAGLVPELVAGLLEEKRASRAFFRTLAQLRPDDNAAIHRLHAAWFGRRVLVLHGGATEPGREAQARHDARQAEALAEALANAGHRPLICSPTAPDLPPSVTLQTALTDCDALCLVLSAASSPRMLWALGTLSPRRGEGAWPLALAIATDATELSEAMRVALVEAPLPCRDPGALQETARAVLARLDALTPEAVVRGARQGGADPWPPPRAARAAPPARPGPTPVADAPRKVLAGEGLEIHQELLARPLQVTRNDGRLEVLLDREGVQSLVLGAEARKAVWLSELGSRRRLARAQAWDAWYREALTGRTGGPPPTDPCPPLRWGSSGAVVEVAWRGELWIPLFFRDIPPFGWNLPLGASGPQDRPDDPLAWGTRELLEELLVLNGDPAWGQARAFQPLLVDDDRDGQATARARAVAHARLPLALRERADHLATWAGEDLPCTARSTGTDLHIRDASGVSVQRDLLVAATPQELGLDVARVLRVCLPDDASLLDGEVLERADGRQELVRMPVALIRAARLRQLFGPGASPVAEEGTPPSTVVDGLEPADLHIFPWDVRRRRELALGTRMAEGPADPLEQARHRAWLDRFGEHFLDSRGEPSCASPSPLFVGSTARLLAAWAHLAEA